MKQKSTIIVEDNSDETDDRGPVTGESVLQENIHTTTVRHELPRTTPSAALQMLKHNHFLIHTEHGEAVNEYEDEFYFHRSFPIYFSMELEISINLDLSKLL
jgi:maleate cis-trans isomerase